MVCNTCDYVMQQVNDGYPPVFWCPRCGTIKNEIEHQEPWLVQRAFHLCEAVLRRYDDPVAIQVFEKDVRECCIPTGE